MWESMVVKRGGRVCAEGDGCMCVFTASVWCESALSSSGCRLQATDKHKYRSSQRP
jgi:hypothetical protein